VVNNPGSTLTLAGSYDNKLIYNHGGIIALNSQSVDDTHFFKGLISGTGTAAAGEMEFHDVEISTSSVQAAHSYGCTFDSTVTMTLAGDYHYINCQSGVAGAGSPTFTKTAGQAITAEFRRWSGGITISGLQSGDTISLDGMFGTITLNGADATVSIKGTYGLLTNNLTGSPTVSTAGAIKGEDVASILVDTNELQTDLVNGGRLDLLIDQIITDIAALNDISAANVATEISDALTVDTRAELSAVPAANAPISDKLNWVFMLARNKIEQTATTTTVRADDTTTSVATSTVSDDGTTATRGELT
jgi:hypothetical protein